VNGAPSERENQRKKKSGRAAQKNPRDPTKKRGVCGITENRDTTRKVHTIQTRKDGSIEIPARREEADERGRKERLVKWETYGGKTRRIHRQEKGQSCAGSKVRAQG